MFARKTFLLATPFVAGSMLLFVPTAALANSLTPGSVISTPLGARAPGPTSVLDATSSGNYTLNDGTSNVGSGTYSINVYSDTFNSFAPNDITITVKVNVGTGDIGRLTLTNFGSSLTNIYDNGGGVDDTSVSRDGSGSKVVINFDSASGIASGQSSSLFVIETDAKSYSPGVLNLIDSGTGHVASFSPTAVPLPSAAGLGLELFGVAGAAAGLNALRRWRMSV